MELDPRQIIAYMYFIIDSFVHSSPLLPWLTSQELTIFEYSRSQRGLPRATVVRFTGKEISIGPSSAPFDILFSSY